MNSTTKPSVLPLNRAIKKDSTSEDYQVEFQDLQEDINKLLDEYVKVQKSQTERIEDIDKALKEEVQTVRKVFKGLGEEFDKFKDKIKDTVQDKLPSEIDNLKKLFDQQSTQINNLEKTISQLDGVNSNESVEELREELVVGIKMLGKRVTKAIKLMDDRFEEFSKKIDANPPTKIAEEEASLDSDFGSIKESVLADSATGYEVVPKNEINKLALLFKKQSEIFKRIIANHHEKIKELDNLLKSYDEENSKVLEMIDKKTMRNYRISMFCIAVLAILTIIFYFIQ